MATSAVESSATDALDADTATGRQILVQALFLGVLADGAIRNAQGGLGWAVWILGLALAAVAVVRHRENHLRREQFAWLAAAVACAAAFAWRDAEMVRLANVLGTLVALALFSMASARAPAPSILAARVRDVIAAGVYAARDVLVGAPLLVYREASLGDSIRSSAAAQRPLLRAVVMTLPLVIVFVALLSRADPVFGSIFNLPDVDAEWLLSHVVMAGAFAWWSAGWLRGALLGTARRGTLPERLPFELGLVEVSATLGALVILFAVFVALQMRWLFGGADVVLETTGLSVAEYARRGFFELVTVTALVAPVILGTRAAIVDDASLRRHRQLSLALLVLLAGIMASAMLRMQLYVAHFGLSEDRLYASVFMLWLAFVFVAMAMTVLRGWARPFAAMAIVSGLATILALNVANPEAIVAHVNLSRESPPRGVDYEYLARLSGDAAPIVAAALSAASPSQATCAAAKRLRLRWIRATDTGSNLGSRRGRAAVLELLPPPRVQQLCETSAP
jgi:hypothetical protein